MARRDGQRILLQTDGVEGVPAVTVFDSLPVLLRSDFDGAVELLLQVLTRLDGPRVAGIASFAP
jgi:hypothetical protein